MSEQTTPAYLRDYDEFWRDLVETNGQIDRDKVARELFDYHGMIQEVPKVYDHVTRGRISKPNTAARHVIAEADEIASKDADEAVKEAREEWADEQIIPASTDLRADAERYAATFGICGRADVIALVEAVLQAELSRRGPAVDVDLEAIQARLDAATPGPWWFDYNWLGERGPYAGVEAHGYPGHFVAECRNVDAPNGLENMTFIANAPTDIAALLAALRRVQSEPPQADDAQREAFMAALAPLIEDWNTRSAVWRRAAKDLQQFLASRDTRTPKE